MFGFKKKTLLNTTTKRRPKPMCRYMEHRDLYLIGCLERLQQDEPAISDKEICHLIRNQSSQQIGMVAETPDCIRGYCLFGWQGDDLHVRRLILHPAEKYGDYEKALIQAVCQRLGNFGRNRGHFKVRELDLGRQMLLKSLGWLATSVDRGYYLDDGQDAYHFTYEHGK